MVKEGATKWQAVEGQMLAIADCDIPKVHFDDGCCKAL
jgi:hypothetical protein